MNMNTINPSMQRANFTVRLLRAIAEVGGYQMLVESLTDGIGMKAGEFTHDDRSGTLIAIVDEARDAGFSMPSVEDVNAALTVDWSKPPCEQVDLAAVTAMILAGLSTAQARITVRAENTAIAILALRMVFQLGLGAAKAIVDEGRTPTMPLADARKACDELNRIYLERAKFGTPFSVVTE